MFIVVEVPLRYNIVVDVFIYIVPDLVNATIEDIINTLRIDIA